MSPRPRQCKWVPSALRGTWGLASATPWPCCWAGGRQSSGPAWHMPMPVGGAEGRAHVFTGTEKFLHGSGLGSHRGVSLPAVLGSLALGWSEELGPCTPPHIALGTGLPRVPLEGGSPCDYGCGPAITTSPRRSLTPCI